MSNKLTALSVAAALAGAATFAAAIPASAQTKVKCYGISKAGENDCANLAGTHSCAGQSKVNFDGGEWKTADSAQACTASGGKTEAFQGVNPAKKS